MIQSIDSVQTYAYGTRKVLICKKEKTKCDNIVKQCKEWLNLMMLRKKNIKEHNPNWRIQNINS